MKYQKKLETDCDLSNEEKRCKTVIHITHFLYSDWLDFVISWYKIKCESRSNIQEEHLRELFYTILLKINCNIPWDLSEGGRNSPMWTKDHNDYISWKTVLCSSQQLSRNFWYEQKIKKLSCWPGPMEEETKCFHEELKLKLKTSRKSRYFLLSNRSNSLAH